MTEANFHTVTYHTGAVYGCYCDMGEDHAGTLPTPTEVLAEHLRNRFPDLEVRTSLPVREWSSARLVQLDSRNVCEGGQAK